MIRHRHRSQVIAIEWMAHSKQSKIATRPWKWTSIGSAQSFPQTSHRANGSFLASARFNDTFSSPAA
jgi:hypothetical protein